MTAQHRTTTVQMPDTPDLFPAYVVAIRPDIDGQWANRGDYVLSVNTPRGARNVVASADGAVEIHVDLMQELEPRSVLFVIHPVEPLTSADLEAGDYGEDVEYMPERPIPPPAPPQKAPSTGRAMGAFFWAYFSLCLIIAALWPGLLNAFPGLPGSFALDPWMVAALWGGALGGLVLLLGLLPFITGAKRAVLVLLPTLVVFAGSFGLGLVQPDIRTLQKDVILAGLTWAVPATSSLSVERTQKGSQPPSGTRNEPQPEKAKYPNLIAMLSAPMERGNHTAPARPKKRVAINTPSPPKGSGRYGPIMELIALPFQNF